MFGSARKVFGNNRGVFKTFESEWHVRKMFDRMETGLAAARGGGFPKLSGTWSRAHNGNFHSGPPADKIGGKGCRLTTHVRWFAKLFVANLPPLSSKFPQDTHNAGCKPGSLPNHPVLWNGWLVGVWTRNATTTEPSPRADTDRTTNKYKKGRKKTSKGIQGGMKPLRNTMPSQGGIYR